MIDAWRERNQSAIAEEVRLSVCKEKLIIANSKESESSPPQSSLFNQGETQESIGLDAEENQVVSTEVEYQSAELSLRITQENCPNFADIINNPVQTVQCTSTAEKAESRLCLENRNTSNYSFATGDAAVPLSPSVLLALLTQTKEGKEITICAKDGELSEAKQFQLAGVIARYHLGQCKITKKELLENYVRVITTLFPHEKAVNYYIPRNGDRKNFGGKVANKIGNLKQKKRKSDAKEEEHRKKIKCKKPIDTLTDPEVQVATEWSKFNSEPWSTVLEMWPKAFHYKLRPGYQLFDIDFHLTNIGTLSGLERLASFRAGLITYVTKHAQDPSADSLISVSIDSSSSEDTKLCTLLLGLNTILLSISAGLHFKPTILVAQEDTILFVPTE
ncbi:uncharacterized protein LOC131438408 [Malaya genurostris]|uniref:uncharacterized protein LOC131438408 n=1 Tax=Malaya genurostris TaxID=325434 RepID=UPI0026F3C19C|nr:uncharacterized protein LOC131438408 [Malaya genurostris]